LLSHSEPMTGFAVPSSTMLPVFIQVKNAVAGRHGLAAIAASVTRTPELVKYVLSSQLMEYVDESKAGIHSVHAENGEIAAILKGSAVMGQTFAAEAYVREGNVVTLIILWITFRHRCHGSLERVYREAESRIFIHLGQASNSKHDPIGNINISPPRQS
ncbi:unnamed protein product, partial [Clonostachys solani]